MTVGQFGQPAASVERPRATGRFKLLSPLADVHGLHSNGRCLQLSRT